MKLLLQREQKSGFTGKPYFTMTVRAELTEEEAEDVKKYGLSKELLVVQEKTASNGSLAKDIYKRMKDNRMTVDKMVKGTNFECKDLAEMLELEIQVKDAALRLQDYLYAAKHFGGEEIIDIEKLAEAQAS